MEPCRQDAEIARLPGYQEVRLWDLQPGRLRDCGNVALLDREMVRKRDGETASLPRGQVETTPDHECATVRIAGCQAGRLPDCGGQVGHRHSGAIANQKRKARREREEGERYRSREGSREGGRRARHTGAQQCPVAGGSQDASGCSFALCHLSRLAHRDQREQHSMATALSRQKVLGGFLFR